MYRPGEKLVGQGKFIGNHGLLGGGFICTNERRPNPPILVLCGSFLRGCPKFFLQQECSAVDLTCRAGQMHRKKSVERGKCVEKQTCKAGQMCRDQSVRHQMCGEKCVIERMSREKCVGRTV